jgi:2-polyprenyl-3-methyl-5-hydroxy-6-metoxy-1,4-benzoquinol methylase
MEEFNRETHWQNIYNTKKLEEVSWYQPTPTTTLAYIKEFNLPLTARIIDVGSGDSFLVDHLLALGYTDITVLDISSNAINRAKKRLDDKAKLVKWIVADAAHFKPTQQYDFWHDRAAFHFLTQENEINNYVNTVKTNIKPNGILVIGTFSEQGPTKCSGIAIKQYTPQTLTSLFSNYFTPIDSKLIDHQTPFNTTQNFVFCSFTKK